MLLPFLSEPMRFGVFVFRREINIYWDLRILLDVDAETSIARALQRDRGPIDGPEIIEKKYRLRYEPAGGFTSMRSIPN